MIMNSYFIYAISFIAVLSIAAGTMQEIVVFGPTGQTGLAAVDAALKKGKSPLPYVSFLMSKLILDHIST